ncbi:MAG: PAS domain S-box protein [Hyphomicrobiales bacterium]|nr:PAS domain S-box protein [Hyphomicrobiales bacterium]
MKSAMNTQEMLEMAFREAPVGIVMTQHRVIRYYNKHFADMFGYEGDELRDRSFAILYPSLDEFVKVGNIGLRPLRETGRYSDERIMARRDGSLFWCRVRGNSLTRDEPLAHAVWSMADLSFERPVMSLTMRERQIVMHLGEGRTSKDIARILEISPRTVEAYRARLLKKLGVSNVAELLSNVGGMPG